MKKRGRELNLKDLKLQIVLGIVLVILVLIIGFISISSNITNSCSSGNYDGSLNAIKSIGGMCTDSDGGIDIFVYGTTTGILSNGRSGSIMDTCLDYYTLSEGYCEDKFVKTFTSTCPDEPCKTFVGCQSGKCKYISDKSMDDVPCGEPILNMKCLDGKCMDLMGIEPDPEPTYGERIGACVGKSEGSLCEGPRFTGTCKYEFGTLVCW
jgi:hypothetical protein